MSKISTYHQKQQLQQQLQEELAALESDQDLKEELKFKEKLEKLMNDFDRSPDTVLEVMGTIEPRIARKLGLNSELDASPKPKAKRTLKTYRNPHTGEEVHTRGGNQKTIKAWKEQHGKDEVESWVVATE